MGNYSGSGDNRYTPQIRVEKENLLTPVVGTLYNNEESRKMNCVKKTSLTVTAIPGRILLKLIDFLGIKKRNCQVKETLNK